MSTTWLLVDTNYLAHRAYHSTGELSHEDIPTGVLYGVFREILYLQDLYGTSRLVFCFDCGRPVRRVHCPTYKENRHKNKSEAEQKVYKSICKQLDLLRDEYLEAIGFRNIFFQEGYEADDVIAQVLLAIPGGEFAIVVSADHDLYQLLDAHTLIYNAHKKKAYTARGFVEEWGLSPTQWVDVKAIAGCRSDEVPGIRGIGEKTAAKFLQGKLKEGTKAYESIVKGSKIWKRNKLIVRLPFPGIKTFKIVDDAVTSKRWERVCKRLGMESLYDLIPNCNRKGFKI